MHFTSVILYDRMSINLRFLVPRKKGEVSAADTLDLYLRGVKEDLGLYTGLLLQVAKIYGLE